MEFKTKKEGLIAEFNQNQQTIQQLANKQQQIIGQLNLLDEIEKIGEKKEEVKKEE